MNAMSSQITGISIVCCSVGLGADQRKQQSLRHWSLRGEFTGDRWNSTHKKANYAENVSILWRDHGSSIYRKNRWAPLVMIMDLEHL